MPKPELGATQLMPRLSFVRMALTILIKSFKEQGVTGQEAVAPWLVPEGVREPGGRNQPYALVVAEGLDSRARPGGGFAYVYGGGRLRGSY